MLKYLHTRRFVLSPALVLAVLISGSASPNVATVAGNGNHELSRAVDTLVSAWNNRDAESIVDLFLPDATLIMPTGKTTRTRAAIRDRLLVEWSGKLKDTTLNHAVESVSLESDNTAIVKGTYRLNGAQILGMEKSPEGQFVFNYAKKTGNWMLAEARLLSERGT